MVAFLKTFFFVTAVSALLKRDYAAVTNDLTSLNSAVTSLSSVVATYTGGLSAALPIQSGYSNVESLFQTTTTEVQNTASVSSTQSTTIFNYVKNTLIGNFRSLLNAFVGKKDKIQNTQGVISSLCSAATSLVNALSSNAATAQKTAYPAVQTSVRSICSSAISAAS